MPSAPQHPHGGMASLTAPLVDHHQHLLSPAAAALMGVAPIDSAALIRHLDEAGIERALVLSVAYAFGSPNRTVEQEHARVQAENDWTAREVERFPERLRGCCSVNPLREYALDELARCATEPALAPVRRGLKLHFGNSVVDYHNPGHIAQVQRLLAAANVYGMAVVVHMRASVSRQLPYGREEARIFLEELLPAAPDVPVQVAHLGGTSGFAADPPLDQALEVFVQAVARQDSRVARLRFDVATNVQPEAPEAERAGIAARIRELGVERILYGSDAAVPGNTPRQGWAAFCTLPLSEAEMQTVMSNIAPYAR